MNTEYIAHSANDDSQATLFDDGAESEPKKEITKPAKFKGEVYQLFDEYAEQAQQLKDRGRLRAVPAVNY